MPAAPVRVEVLSTEVGGETRYGVMAVHRYGTGLGYVVHYGNRSQGGNNSDWGESPKEAHNMKIMAEGLPEQLASG